MNKRPNVVLLVTHDAGRYKYVRCFEKSSHHRVPGDIIYGGASRELVQVPRSGVEELFDLQQDPNASRNQAADEALRVLAVAASLVAGGDRFPVATLRTGCRWRSSR